MLLSTLLSAKAASGIAAAGVVVLGGGTVAAAATGTLPTPLQNFAHSTFGAPASQNDSTESPDPTDTQSSEPADTHTPESGTPSASPSGPDATGPAAFGLCNAYSHGGLKNPTSPAYQALLKAATASLATASPSPSPSPSTDQQTVTFYCSTVAHPGNAPSNAGRPTSLPTQAKGHAIGRPSSVPHGKPSSVPHGKPSSVPVGKPSGVPSH